MVFMADNKIKIKEFIIENFLFGTEEEPIEDDTSFLEQGIVDSTGILELVEWLENEFQISVADDELIPENLDSIHRIFDYLEKKRQN